MIEAVAIEGLPEISPGFDLAAAVVERLAFCAARPPRLCPGDALVIAHKAISKSEGRIRALTDVEPSELARTIAREQNKDPRHVQVVLDETKSLIRVAHGVVITETQHGFICANAGVDASNVPGDDVVVMLPLDPDASARAMRARLRELTGVAPAVLVTDSFGRAWRTGQSDVAIGCAGLRPSEDWRGSFDRDGRELHATLIAIADELAAAADLARSKDGGQPVVLVRGVDRHVTPEDGPGATALIRAPEQDLFR